LLEGFHQELLKFNKTINLISARSAPEADLLHFADSIMGSRLVGSDCTSKEIYDFGSGNGFPGIVMAILYPSIRFILMESDRRKSEFLKHSSSILGLSNVAVRPARIESIVDNTVEAAICRGFANLQKTLLISRRLMKLGGKIYSFKGPEWSYEIAMLPEQICSTWNTHLLGEYELPGGGYDHCVVVSTKTR
jgi:16S rRNA (guanine527-N7)-methyltransferase